MRVRTGAPAWVLLCLATGCSEVIVMPGGGGGATAVSNGGGAEGGASPGPVPGCEELVWAGEPLVLPGVFHPSDVSLAPLDAGRVGVVYRDHYDSGPASEVVLSTVLDGAFDSWPPTAEPEIAHLDAELFSNIGFITSRPDGTFSLGGHARAIFRFDQVDPLVRFDSWVELFVEPDAGGGVYVVRGEAGTGVSWLEHHATIPDPNPTMVGTIALAADACGSFLGHPAGANPLLVFAPRHHCEGLGGPAIATSFTVDGATVTPQDTLELPFFPRRLRVAPRAGGYWFAISHSDQGTVVHRLTASGAVVGTPWVGGVGNVYGPQSFAPWRDGFALSTRGPDGVALDVSNGQAITHQLHFVEGLSDTTREMPLLAGGENDSSVLMAFESIDGIQILRADCLTLE